MKTFKTFLIAATMLVVSGSASAAITKGADGFYSIGSAADMAEFATIAATDHSACARLTASFIMATTPWTGLTGYAGTFDGNGNTIRRMAAPLCLTTSGGAVIKNLMLQGSLTSTQARFGAFVCDHTGGSLTIENCTNSTSITSDYDRTGGFIGNVAAGTVTMTDCTNSSSITSTKGNVAGLVGDASSTSTTLTNCVNSGAIECTGSLAQVAGLVGTCRAAANATIKFSHCTNRGTITGKANTSGNSNMAGLLGWLSSTSGKTATIEYCANTAAITGTGNNIAALLGQAAANTVVNVTNSYNTGNITGGSGSDVRTLCGKVVTPSNCTITNCWNAGTLTGGTSKTLAISTTTITNSYTIASDGISSAQGAGSLIDGFEDSWISNGHFTYYVNQNAGSTIYYQNIDSGTADAYPTLNSSHGTVYASGTFRCDGTADGTVTYTNTYTESTIPPHTIADGICSVCGSYDPDCIIGGVYQIGTAAQLRWFSSFVNKKVDDSNYADAVLTADIDLGGELFTPIGRFGDNSSTKVNYCGTFDGQGHVIKNLNVNEGDDVEAGLFGRVRYGAIKNLGVVNAMIQTNNTNGRAGIIAGFNFSETFTNCFSTGNLLISGTDHSNKNWGGIVGGTYGNDQCTYINCWTTYDGMLDGNLPATATRTNCYATNDSRVNAITADQVSNGNLCYLLNGSSSQSPTWYQNLDNGQTPDAYPVMDSSHGTVYLVLDGGNTTYSNSQGDISLAGNVSFLPNPPVSEGGTFRLSATSLRSGDQLMLTSAASSSTQYILPLTCGTIDGYVTIPSGFTAGDYILTLVRGSQQQNLGTATFSLHSQLPMGPSQVIAHRGHWDTAGAAQNSRASLRNALNLGVYGSELDVWLTTDGRLMVNHDASRNGVTIASSTYAQCKDLLLDNGETMPTLDEMLDILAATTSPTKLIIEIKEHSTDALNRAAADATMALVADYGMQDKVEYISFSSVACERIIAQQPTAKVSYLDDVNEELSPATLKAKGYSGIDYRQNKMLNHREWYAEARESGMTVNVWTVDEPVIMSYLMNYGADYISTNDPVTALTTEAQTQTLSEASEAVASITDLAKHRISTEIGGTTYYLTTQGTLTSSISEAGIFTMQLTAGFANNSAPSAYDCGYHIFSGKTYFTNTPMYNSKANLDPGHIWTTDEYARTDYESPVLFLRDGKYAVRASNTTVATISSTSAWPDCGRVFWAVKSGTTTGYTYEPQYIWSFTPVAAAADDNITGQITAAGIPVAGVTVSDGVEVTVTDADGRYALTSEKKNGYVFYSLPRGYEPSLADGFRPQFWAQLDSEDPAVSETHDFELLPADNDDYTLILGADSHLANRQNDLNQYEQGYIARIKEENAAAKAANRPIYSMILGDLAWDYYWYGNNYDLQSFMQTCKDTGYPMALWPVIGNHDNDGAVPASAMTDFLAAGPWRKYVSPNYYSMNLGRVHYIILDDILYLNEPTGGSYPTGVVGSRNYKSQITDEQMEWLAKDLALIEDKTAPIVVALHIPTWELNSTTFDAQGYLDMGGAEALAEALSEFSNVHIVSGHTHINYTAHPAAYPNIVEHNIAGICATWWWTGQTVDRHICRDGSPGGYSRWTVSGDDINWEYQAIDPRDNSQLRIYDMNTVRQFYQTDSDISAMLSKYSRQDYSTVPDNQVMVNVFAYDEGWNVEIFEGDTKLTATRVLGDDPLHIISYNLPRYKARGGSIDNTSFGTCKTAHLFTAQATTATEPIRVKVTDNFGRTYERTITRPLEFSTTMDIDTDPNQNINLVFIGNSITYGATLADRATQAPPVVTGGLVQTATGVSTHVYNGGVSGYSTQDFLDDKSDCYTNVVTNATRLSQNGGRLYFSIQLGTNDSKRNSTKERYSKATYKANLEALIANLTTQFPDCKIILNYPPWYSANTYTDASEFTEEGQQLLHSYYDVIDEVAAANDKVFAGDRNTWDVFEDRTDLYSPETSVNAVGEYYLHPNAEGASRLAMIWTKGILPVVESDGISATTAATVRQGLTAGNYGTICLPQEVTDATGATFYKVASKTIKEGDIKFISLEEVNELTAGEAYIYQATADKIDVTYVSNYEVKTPVAATKSGTGVTGVFTRTAIPVGYYMVKNNLIYLVDVADWAFAGANKGWLELDGIAEDNGSAGSHRVVMFVDSDDDPTGLDNSEQRLENNSQTSNLKPQTIYDLQGRKVTQPQKGHIYLINGKKVTVK